MENNFIRITGTVDDIKVNAVFKFTETNLDQAEEILYQSMMQKTTYCLYDTTTSRRLFLNFGTIKVTDLRMFEVKSYEDEGPQKPFTCPYDLMKDVK